MATVPYCTVIEKLTESLTNDKNASKTMDSNGITQNGGGDARDKSNIMHYMKDLMAVYYR